MFQKNIFLYDEMILCKASQLLSHINSGMPENQRVNLTFSNGWLYRFKNEIALNCIIVSESLLI